MDIVVASCIKYSDAWSPFVALFRKFWPSCPFRLTLITDRMDIPWHGDRAIVLDGDLGWPRNLALGLASIPSETILLLQEDFFISADVEAEFIGHCLHKMQTMPDVECLRLMPCPGSDIDIDNDIGEVAIEAPYRISCQAAIWRKEYLLKILTQVDTITGFELAGTDISRRLPGRVLSVRRDRPRWPLQYLCSAIGRGMWSQDAVKLCKQHKISIDTSKRPIEQRPSE